MKLAKYFVTWCNPKLLSNSSYIIFLSPSENLEIDGLVNLTCCNTYAVGLTNVIYYMHHLIQIWTSSAQIQVPLYMQGSMLSQERGTL